MDTTRHTPRLRSFRTPVRGHAFAPRPPDTAGPIPGQLARLIREPGNPADPLAVGVWVADARGRWRIGYLDRGVAARLAPRLDDGLELAVEVEGWTSEPDGRWQRPVVVVEPPSPARSPGGNAATTPTGTSRLWGRPPGVLRRSGQASVSSASSSGGSSGSGSGSGSGRWRVPTSTMRSCGT